MKPKEMQQGLSHRCETAPWGYERLLEVDLCGIGVGKEGLTQV